MRRIILLVTVALVAMAMVAFAAGPAFAVFNCNETSQELQCQGGAGSGGSNDETRGGGGSGGHVISNDPASSPPLVLVGGGGGGGSDAISPGGTGRRCVLQPTVENPYEYVCVGEPIR